MSLWVTYGVFRRAKISADAKILLAAFETFASWISLNRVGTPEFRLEEALGYLGVVWRPRVVVFVLQMVKEVTLRLHRRHLGESY